MGGDNIPQQLRTDISFDLVLSQNRIDHYPIMIQLATQLNCPLLQMEHTLPWPDWDSDTTIRVGAFKCDHNIFVSRFSAEAWSQDPDNPDTSIIWHGMDTDFWDGWVGGDKKIMTAVWDFARRDRICGFSLFKQVTAGLKINPWGNTPGFSKMADNVNHLRELYRHASVYLNTTLWSSCPFSLLEAMSVGCPVVTTATTMMPEFIQDGVNGFITNDPAVMSERLKLLIDDPNLGAQIGQAGRQTIIEKFGKQRFLNEWDAAFRKTAECPPGRLV
jgi:glycosyltransferase involved in cell wall biosynthesis